MELDAAPGYISYTDATILELQASRAFTVEYLKAALKALSTLTIRLLVQYGSGRLTTDQLGELAHHTAQRLSLLYEFNSPEFFDKVVLRNFIGQLVEAGLVDLDPQQQLTFGDTLRTLDDEARRILSPDISQAIQRITRVPELDTALAATHHEQAGDPAKGTEAGK
ncbi:hypothetical protein [Halomonas sp. N3-2A]|uniref:hypothetical protein n=1 Tax=Halomonas sp. N3-2A TaxID=2014541 RepID=UPI001E364B48|nr:hypothetical protein [Halomonas sp. N3-2A]